MIFRNKLPLRPAYDTKAQYRHVKNMLCSSARLSGLSRRCYETHQRHQSECGLVSIAHCWLLAMNNLLNCLCKCCSLILSEQYWLPGTRLTRLDEHEGKGTWQITVRAKDRSEVLTLAFGLLYLSVRRWHFNQSACPVNDKGKSDDWCLGD